MKLGNAEVCGERRLAPFLTNYADTDIRSLFAYLQSIPAIKNRVPQPVEAPEQQ